jgi:hypothetical protein
MQTFNRNKLLRVLAGFCAGIVLGFVLGVLVARKSVSTRTQHDHTVVSPTVEQSWRRIGIWRSSRENERTELFLTHSPEWRVSWRSDTAGAILEIYRGGDPANGAPLVKKIQGTRQGSAMIASQPGLHMILMTPGFSPVSVMAEEPEN